MIPPNFLNIRRERKDMNCPKCGGYIPFYDLKSNCKHCGINIMYYTQEFGLIEDAKRAELEFASARIVTAKIKASFIGGALQITRLVFTVLCIAALVAPFAAVHIDIPIYSYDITISGIGVYNMFSDGILLGLKDLIGSSLLGEIFGDATVLLIMFLLIAISCVLIIVNYLFSFLNIKKTAKFMTVFSFINAALCIAEIVFALICHSKFNGVSYLGVNVGFGAFAALAVFAAEGVINLKIFKNDIEVKYRPNDLLRKDLLKKVKAGEIKYSDLPLPIFETEEEKEKRLRELEDSLKKEEEESSYD